MSQLWVVIASPRILHIYSATQNAKEIRLIKELDHPESRLSGIALSPGADGHYRVTELGFSSSDGKKSKQMENDYLACQLAEELDVGALENQYEKILLFANQQFYTAFQQHGSKEVIAKTMYIPKDFSHLAVAALPEAIQAHLN